MRKKILILNGQYLPGYKGGGPIISCANMVENLSDQFDFYVLCADRDYKENKPYVGIRRNQWNQVGSANVYYMSPEAQSLKGFEKMIKETEYDVLYLNGFFSPVFTIKPLILRRMGRLNNEKSKIILAPRGDFTGGCENKKIKKYGYIYFAKIFGLYKDLLWHASSEIENLDIKKKFPKAKIFVAPDLPARFVPKNPMITKKRGEVRLVFVSRIFPKKNIKYALEVLMQIDVGNVIFDIYGPMEDRAYWSECEDLIKKMPPNVTVKYCGEAEHEDIPYIFEQYHVFFFPTLGENYGHVIAEAMMNNCLCLLSKGVTPWDDYIEESGLGAELNNKEKFVRIIKDIINFGSEEMREKLVYTAKYIEKKTDIVDITRKYKYMLGDKI